MPLGRLRGKPFNVAAGIRDERRRPGASRWYPPLSIVLLIVLIPLVPLAGRAQLIRRGPVVSTTTPTMTTWSGPSPLWRVWSTTILLQSSSPG